MALHAHTVDAQAFGLEVPDQPADGLALFLTGQRVVVVVQLGIGVGLVGGAEGQFDELLAQKVEVGRLAERAVVLDGLVHHIPAVYLTLEVADDGLDVLDEPLPEYFLGGRTGRITVGKPPVGSLRVPDEAVPQHLQLVLLTVADELIGYAEVEDALGRSQRLRLHTVLGHGAVEVLVDDGITLGHLPVTLPLVDGRADEAVLADGVL